MGNANLVAPATPSQIWALQIVRMVASIPSLFGAFYIIQHVLRSPKRRQRCVTRILLGMSSMDLIFAFSTLMSSVILPAEFSKKYQLARGSWTTCQAFGFLYHGASVSSMLYNASLTLFYLLTIRYGWRECQITQSWFKMEVWMHALPLLIGWSTALSALLLDLYNPMPFGCVIREYPKGCTQKEKVECQRGENARFYRWPFVYVWMWSVFAFLIVAMAMIYRKIAQVDRSSPRSLGSDNNKKNRNHHAQPQEQQQPPQGGDENKENASSAPPPTRLSLNNVRSSMGRSMRNMARQASSITGHSSGVNGSSSSNNNASSRKKLNRLKHQFATQALLYCLAYLLTWIFPTVNLIRGEWTDGPTYIPLVFLSVMMCPLQGFFNAFIYIRPRYLRYRKKQRDERKRQAREQEQQQNYRMQQRNEQQQRREQEQRPQQEQSGAGTVRKLLRFAPSSGTNMAGGGAGIARAFISAMNVDAEDDEDEYQALEDEQCSNKNSRQSSVATAPSENAPGEDCDNSSHKKDHVNAKQADSSSSSTLSKTEDRNSVTELVKKDKDDDENMQEINVTAIEDVEDKDMETASTPAGPVHALSK